ncbi:MAG TPA: hypothetical protein VJ784_03170 [Pyrinomonadaceae bacterium]|nr:hypothetical protein [Pyrinomonadaceae bacterium]
MTASLLDVLSVLRNWKNDGKTLRMKLVQNGHMTLDGEVLIDDASNDKQAVFRFGFSALASGIITIPLDSEFVLFDILTSDQPRPLDPLDPTYDKCVQFSWNLSNDRCTVCAARFTGRSYTI